MRTGAPALTFLVCLGIAASTAYAFSGCGAASTLTPDLSSGADASAGDGANSSVGRGTRTSHGGGSSGASLADASALEAGTDPCAIAQDNSTVDTDTVPVDAAILSGNVPPCAEGYEHPNVCCDGARCFERDKPFYPCGCAALTFPDPRTCCPIGFGGSCQPVIQVMRNPSGCQFPCGPGATFPSRNAGALDACLTVPNVAVAGGMSPDGPCAYCCYRGGCATDVPGCDAHECSPPPTWGCGICPQGWQNMQGIPDLCCIVDAAGVSTECFSQAGWIDTRPFP